MNAEINLPNVLATVFSTTPARPRRAAVRRGEGRHDLRAHRRGQGARGVVRQRGQARRSGRSCACRTGSSSRPTTSPDRDLRLGIARPVGDSLANLRKTAARNAGLGLLFVAVALVGIVPLSSRLTRNFSTLSEAVAASRTATTRARVPVQVDRRSRPARAGLQSDGGRRRTASAHGRRAGAHPPRARTGPADSERHAAARAARRWA